MRPSEASPDRTSRDAICCHFVHPLYDSLKSWFRRAIVASSLSPAERYVALRATPHWPRHTCGTRALERGATLNDVQAQFGHANPTTTSRYTRAQLHERQRVFENAFVDTTGDLR